MSSSPGWILGYVPPPAEWNTTFANKADETEMAAKLNAAGTPTNDSAAAGQIGEYLLTSVASGAVSLTTAISANMATLSLTPGDWDVYGSAVFAGAGGAAPSALVSGINTTSATLPGAASGALATYNVTFSANSSSSIPVGPVRISLAAPTTIYLVGLANFAGVGTMTGGGFIGARRAR